MEFEAAQSYLLSLGNEVSAMKLGLASMRTLLAALGDPQKRFLKVQIAGTNGKGSTCAFLDSILRTAKVPVGLYTSPHLTNITERIGISGREIGRDEFASLASRVRGTCEELVAAKKLESVPTFFEQITAIALLAFAQANVRIAILETGLGGRLDATTAASAEIAAITRIDRDHERYLGNSLVAIANEKAAIIHSGTRFAVIGKQRPWIKKILIERCRALNVPFAAAESSADMDMSSITLGLAGKHQIENAAIAVEIADHLAAEFPISRENIVEGLAAARNPGRLERIGQFILDGAHNPNGVKALAAYLREKVEQPITLIFAVMEDKKVRALMKELFPLARTIVLTEARNSRSVPYEKLLKKMPVSLSKERVFATANSRSAVAAAEAADPDAVIVVAGSLYLVGEVRDLITGRGSI